MDPHARYEVEEDVVLPSHCRLSVRIDYECVECCLNRSFWLVWEVPTVQIQYQRRLTVRVRISQVDGDELRIRGIQVEVDPDQRDSDLNQGSKLHKVRRLGGIGRTFRNILK